MGELLDASFHIYRRHFFRLLVAATVLSIPALVLSGLFASTAAKALQDYSHALLKQALKPPDPLEQIRLMLENLQRVSLVTFVEAFLQALSRGATGVAMALAAWSVVMRRPMPPAADLVRRTLPRLPAAVLGRFVVEQALLAPLCCCLPAYIIAYVLLVLPLPAIIALEQGDSETRMRAWMKGRPGPVRAVVLVVAMPVGITIDACKRGMELGWHAATIGRGTGYAFFVYMFVGIFVGGVTGVVALVAANFGIEADAALFWLQHYAEVVVLPVSGLAVALWYLDLRVRREGLDLSVGAAA